MGGQAVRVVNVDVVFLINFVADLLWLWVTARLARVPVRRWRLVVGAVAGALLAVWAALDEGGWVTLAPGLIAGTLALLAVTFLPCSIRQALRTAGYFLFSGALAAGAVVLGQLRMPGGLGVASYSTGVVAAGLILAGAGAKLLWEAARTRSQLARGLYGLQVTLGGQSVILSALVDTGNHLRDPLSGTPVAVVEAQALRPLLPPEVYRAVARGWEGLERLPAGWAARCRLVPYQAVGRSDGMLLALTVDAMAVQAPGGGEWAPAAGLVGLAISPLHSEGAYRALLPQDLLPAG
jgi:stage II sporulation protein GA (sporulation sigma-E factor processing peptidase)